MDWGLGLMDWGLGLWVLVDFVRFVVWVSGWSWFGSMGFGWYSEFFGLLRYSTMVGRWSWVWWFVVNHVMFGSAMVVVRLVWYGFLGWFLVFFYVNGGGSWCFAGFMVVGLGGLLCLCWWWLSVLLQQWLLVAVVAVVVDVSLLWSMLLTVMRGKR